MCLMIRWNSIIIPCVSLLFRNYYHELFDKYPKLGYFALGYKRKFWNNYTGESPRMISHHARNYTWSFAGAPRTPERQAVLKNV